MVIIKIKVLVRSPYQSTLKYPYHKKNANPNVHVIVFHVVIRTNGETSKEYIINAFSYTLKEIASYWCHNYMSKFHNNNFMNRHKCFANIITRGIMTNIFIGNSRISNEEKLSESKCTMNTYKSWFMDCKHQP
jgi:hypothetical protein